jgi:hypothetical protein
VKDLHWCLDDFRTIRLNSLVKNMLCAAHNPRLSEADVGAIQLRKALCDSASLSEVRNTSRTLVQTAFGLRQFQPPRAGLHWIRDVGELLNVADGVVVTTFSNHAN